MLIYNWEGANSSCQHLHMSKTSNSRETKPKRMPYLEVAMPNLTEATAKINRNFKIHLGLQEIWFSSPRILSGELDWPILHPRRDFSEDDFTAFSKLDDVDQTYFEVGVKEHRWV